MKWKYEIFLTNYYDNKNLNFPNIFLKNLEIKYVFCHKKMIWPLLFLLNVNTKSEK